MAIVLFLWEYVILLNMVITTLEGVILPRNQATLINTYRELVADLPPEIVETFLVQDEAKPNVWRIVTVWRSREDLKAMRSRGTPTGVLIFRAAQSEPKLTVNQVEIHVR